MSYINLEKKCKIKKGVTLIELIIVIGIMSMTFISLSSFVKSAKWYENKIKVDYSGNSIMIFINEARQYCKSNNYNGLILVDITGNMMEFYIDNAKRIAVFKPPEGIKITSFLDKDGDNKIKINNLGSISDAGTFTYKDLNGEYKKVTIRVGSEYVHVYE